MVKNKSLGAGGTAHEAGIVSTATQPNNTTHGNREQGKHCASLVRPRQHKKLLRWLAGSERMVLQGRDDDNRRILVEILNEDEQP